MPMLTSPAGPDPASPYTSDETLPSSDDPHTSRATRHGRVDKLVETITDSTDLPNTSIWPSDKPDNPADDGAGQSAQPTSEPHSVSPSAEATTQPPTQPPDSSKPAPTSQQPTSDSPKSSAQPTHSQEQQSSAQPTSQWQEEQPASSSAQQTTEQWSQAPASEEPSSATSTTQPSSSASSSSPDRAPTLISLASGDTSELMTSTDSNGKVYTVTAVVHHATSHVPGSDSQQPSKGFMANKGAVAGVFVALGLVLASAVIAIMFFVYRRKRRQRLDRDIATLASSNRSRRDEDEKSTGARSTFIGGPYGGDLNEAPQQTVGAFDYADPTGGYDHYAMNLAATDNRMSTATAAGFAGFGAHSAQAAYQTHTQPGDNAYDYATSGEGYEQLDGADDGGRLSTGSRSGYNAVTTDHEQLSPHSASGGGGNQYYFDPNSASEYYQDDHDPQEELQHPKRGHQRTGSEGSVTKDMSAMDRGLTVTNV